MISTQDPKGIKEFLEKNRNSQGSHAPDRASQKLVVTHVKEMADRVN